MWAHSGRELLYISTDGQMMSAAVEAGSTFRVTERSVLFDLPPGSYVTPLTTSYDITPDDEQFILVRSRGVGLEERAPIVLIENWLEEVKERGGG